MTLENRKSTVFSHAYAKRRKKSDFTGGCDVMIDRAPEDEEAFAQNFRELSPMEKDPAWKMLEKPKHWGVKDASTRMDEYLYRF